MLSSDLRKARSLHFNSACSHFMQYQSWKRGWINLDLERNPALLFLTKNKRVAFETYVDKVTQVGFNFLAVVHRNGCFRRSCLFLPVTAEKRKREKGKTSFLRSLSPHGIHLARWSRSWSIAPHIVAPLSIGASFTWAYALWNLLEWLCILH